MTRRAPRVVIVTPAPRGSRSGNRVTAERWARLLRDLGLRARVTTRWSGQGADVLIALHAIKSAPSIDAFARAHPGRPLVLALGGTDLNEQGRTPRFARSLALATRVVALQPLALRRLPRAARSKARVIVQSARPAPRRAPRADAFEVLVLAHLRPVKDPLLAAHAARLLPESSRMRVLHAGAALSPALARAARQEERRNPRYRWLGNVAPARAAALLARARALVITSRAEGAPAVLSEAVVAGVPVLATDIEAARGLLGSRHPGLFPVGDAAALAALLRRCEDDPAVLRRIGRSGQRLASSLTPARERAAWKRLLEELAP